jgi:serine/threonine protein kinase
VILKDKTSLQTKLVDFGFSEVINYNELTNKSGTPGYIAPEIFSSQPYTEKGDIFSLGVIFFSLIGGYSPFKGL